MKIGTRVALRPLRVTNGLPIEDIPVEVFNARMEVLGDADAVEQEWFDKEMERLEVDGF